jgi:hypothetical protein
MSLLSAPHTGDAILHVLAVLTTQHDKGDTLALLEKHHVPQAARLMMHVQRRAGVSDRPSRAAGTQGIAAWYFAWLR